MGTEIKNGIPMENVLLVIMPIYGLDFMAQYFFVAEVVCYFQCRLTALLECFDCFSGRNPTRDLH